MTNKSKFKKFIYFHDQYDKVDIDGYGMRSKTLASYYNEETNELQIGIAVCSSEDSFKKRTGRILAGLRAINKPIMTIKVHEDYKPQGLLPNVANMFLNAR